MGILEGILFILFFCAVFFLLNLYVWGRIFYFLNLGRGKKFYSGLVLLSSSYLIAMGLLRLSENFFTTIVYIVASVWLGILFLTFCCLLVGEVVNWFKKFRKKTIGIAVLVLTASLSLFSLINASFLDVQTINLNFPQPLKVVQLSDVHVGTVHNEEYLERITKKVNALNPDVVLITGDLVDGSAAMRPGMFDELKKIKAKIYFSTGNHETYEGNIADVLKIITDSGIEVLDNRAVDFQGVQLVGVSYKMQRDNLKTELEKINIDKTKPTILMYHEPRDGDVAADFGVDLMLSGHTHNGQLAPFNLAVKLVYPYINGIYNVGNMNWYVSPGTGTWGPPMRLGSQSTITFFDLK
jgi:hypothetical protein